MPDLIIALNYPDYSIAAGSSHLPELGHAGLLLIKASNGLTKYFEYGRYDAAELGLVRNKPIPNAVLGPDGRPTDASWRAILGSTSSQSGQDGRIVGAIATAPNQFGVALHFAQDRMNLNSDPDRPPYRLLTRNCMHFVKDAFSSAGLPVRSMVDPRPNSYIDELRIDYQNVDYNPVGNVLIFAP